MDKDKYLDAKWTPLPGSTQGAFLENRRRIEKMVAGQWAEKMNHVYGPLPPENQYTPESMYADPDVPGDDKNRAPLTTDLVAFVVWLRESTDFFSGPNLDIQFPRADAPEFYEVLAQNALLYTEE